MVSALYQHSFLSHSQGWFWGFYGESVERVPKSWCCLMHEREKSVTLAWFSYIELKKLYVGVDE